ncbi:ligase-associated DNA damage response endonuclease PdeM [Lutibaculum baratangense]|uniref:Calcineurin-like phosphoesterase domain-containing protein n=1 Tax=Lutibaculum baratangense AMV1 TaxID=631454 RepID=V4RMC1_9HYPH|nr:ligase-associated DNA damage response endonuclease PdeM [Lutibaculum baratangense]ESR26414.1 hypothetical protein N177_0914 [Lutibaculum baratangense AMV1]
MRATAVPERVEAEAETVRTVGLCGHEVALDPAGALWWAAERTLVVSDLHLEKGSSLARRGQLLPPYDTAATLRRLAALVETYLPARVVCLGDSFHDRRAAERLAPAARDTVRALQRGRDWIWIAGNHDRDAPAGLGGEAMAELNLNGLAFRHEPRAGDCRGEVAGHLHPAAKLRLRGRGLRRRCFVTDGARLVMPSFGAYTGGLNVLDAAWSPLFPPRGFAAWLLGGRGVYGFPARLLLPDAA